MTVLAPIRYPKEPQPGCRLRRSTYKRLRACQLRVENAKYRMDLQHRKEVAHARLRWGFER